MMRLTSGMRLDVLSVYNKVGTGEGPWAVGRERRDVLAASVISVGTMASATLTLLSSA
jgi:hypothetical protein